jgi:hypothetical protein
MSDVLNLLDLLIDIPSTKNKKIVKNKKRESISIANARLLTSNGKNLEEPKLFRLMRQARGE